jgi:probable phosphoglycerate mutase
MRKVLYFARHGETEWNATGRLQGQTDVALNAVGRAQALLLASRLRGAGIVSVGSSDLAGARATAEIVARELGLAVSYVDAGLRERAYGVFEGLTLEEARARDPAAWASLADRQSAPRGGESLDALATRILGAAERAAGALDAPALVVSHGRALRELVSAIRGEAVAAIANVGAYRVVLDDGRFVEAALFGGA